MASLSLRVAPPRPFSHNETHDSLTQHKFLFNNFYRKDKDFKPILKSTFTWDARRDNYGVTAKQHKQLLLICRENLSQHTTAKILDDETADSIRDALIAAVIELMPDEGTTVRLDPAPGNQTLALETDETDMDDTSVSTLQNDSVLSKYGIKIELGRVHNVNKNPIAENAVKEYNKEVE